MGAGASVTDNTQISNSNLVQTYAGTCDISCTNQISNTTVASINSQIKGNLGVTQTCAVNGQCSFDVSQSALTDTVFKTNTSAVTSTPLWGTFDFSSARSYQQINQYINQTVMQKCNIDSINTINNVDVYAVNSTITGNVGIGQVGQATGGCAMKTVMDATSLAAGTADVCASSGKKGKKSCGGKSGKSLGSILIYGGAALIIFVIIMITYRYFAGKKLPPCKADMPPGTKCEPPKGHVLPPVQYGPAPYGASIGQEYIEPIREDPANIYGPRQEIYEPQGYEQGYEGPPPAQKFSPPGLEMSPGGEAQEFTPQYLEAIGEN
ncbi:MAG TPA: hypothetical protein PKD85_08975 [Saprospiraceae bacterium]|nr:hypothetical protein [Saprospiraceae bacterium]